MTNISPAQARARFKSLPENLQEALFSAQTAEIIGRIGEQNHLPDEKLSKVAEAAGIAILGFIHIEELAGEVQERAQLPPEVAKNIAASLENRILNSIRSDLEKIYAPAAEPEKLEEIRKPTPPAAPVGGPPPKPFIDLASLTKTAPSPGPAGTGKPPAPPTPGGGLAPQPTAAAPKPTPAAASAPPVPPAPAPAAPVSPARVPPAPLPATPPVPAPILLKRKLELEPLKPEASIRLEPGSQFVAGKTQVPQPPRPARLEIGLPAQAGKPPIPPAGQAPKPGPGPAGLDKPARTEASLPRVVHYSQWQTPAPQADKPSPSSVGLDKPSPSAAGLGKPPAQVPPPTPPSPPPPAPPKPPTH